MDMSFNYTLGPGLDECIGSDPGPNIIESTDVFCSGGVLQGDLVVHQEAFNGSPPGGVLHGKKNPRPAVVRIL